jgi:uroporphyrinogen decarboxylase
MTKRERVRATLKGSKRDRPPVSFWRHFYEREDSATGLAEAMVAFQRKYDWDFIKVNPRASYHGEGWGLKVRFRGREGLKPERVDYPIKTVRDWDRIRVLPPDQGALAEMLDALRLIRAEIGPEVPVVQTVFTPLSVAGDLVDSNDRLLLHMRENPAAVHNALQAIAQTFADYAKKCLEAGADGIFLATTEWASYDLLTSELYLQFGRPYDLQVLAAVSSAELNILHVCGPKAMLMELLDYPVNAFNWAATVATNPSLGEILDTTEKAAVGGVDEKITLRTGSWSQVKEEMRRAREQDRVGRWILGAGCVLPTDILEERLIRVREEIERL